MSKPLWLILILLTGSLALWRTSTVLYHLFQYNRLNLEAPARVEKVEVLPRGSKYALRAHYRYEVQGKMYKSRTLMAKPYYLNNASAQQEAELYKEMSWTAWVDAKNPAFSSIDPKFPLRESAYALCLLGIFLYFCYLKFHDELLKKQF